MRAPGDTPMLIATRPEAFQAVGVELTCAVVLAAQLGCLPEVDEHPTLAVCQVRLRLERDTLPEKLLGACGILLQDRDPSHRRQVPGSAIPIAQPAIQR